MIKQNLKLTVAAVILLCVCIGTVSGTTVTAQGGTIASLGSSVEFPVIVDSLPSGLTGFNITVALSDSAKAEILDVTFPPWAGDGFVFAGNGPLPADSVWITVVDLYDNVQVGATNVELASLEIRGDANGTTGLLLTGVQIEDEGGYPVPYTVVNGTITIGTTPPPVVNGTISVQSTPTASDVILDGIYKGITPLSIPNVSAGDHTLRVEKSGYYPWENLVTVTAGVTNSVTAALTAIPPSVVNGTISVQSTPTGSDVILDGSYKGTTPLTIPDVGAGVHTLRLEKTGYYPYQDSITVNAGLTTNVTWILTEIPPVVVNGTISVQSTPTGADIILDGAGKGTTPLTIPDVGAGVHTLRLEKTGYYPYQDSITVNAGLTTNVTWILTEIPPLVVNGTIIVQSTPTGADIILDGAGKGTTPLTIPDVGAGIHTLRLEKTGYYPWENPVIVVAGETANVAAVLSIVPPATGSLAVQTDPEGANVYLDTEFIGLSPVSIGNVSPGSHSVQIEKDGFEPREVNTTVSAGATTIVSVALTPLPPPTTGMLSVQSDPVGANLYVDTDFKGITPLLVQDLDPGLHTVRVEKDGYIPYENASVSITAGVVTQVDAILDIVPVPETGEIEINSTPSGAAVYLDGVLKGPTPLTISNLYPQSYAITIEKSGYQVWEENVTVVAGETALILAELLPIPTPTPTQTPTPIPTTTLQGTGGLLVVSDPTATVFIDGIERGMSNDVIGNVIGGTRNVTLVKAGYKTTSFPVTIPVTRVAITPKIFLEPAGVPTTVPTTAPTTIPTISPTLTPTTSPTTIPTTSGPFPPGPTTGSIFVYSVPLGCSVYVDEVFKGTSPGFFGMIEPGTHELRLVRAGYLDDVRAITVHAGEVSTVLVMMVPDVGSIISAFL